MITWPFDAETYGLPTTVRDEGAWVVFAGTPYSHLHVCGTPWDGNEYREGDKQPPAGCSARVRIYAGADGPTAAAAL